MWELFERYTAPKYLIKIIAITALYFVLAKFGLSLASETKQITLVWPPTGIAIASLVLFGIEFWPAVALGAFLANITTSEPFSVALGITLGNTLEAVVAAFMLKVLGFNRNFLKIKDVVLFIVFGVILAPTISATFGTTSLVLGGIGSWETYPINWFNWWVGDAVGCMVVAPAVFIWSRVKTFKLTLQEYLEGIGIMGIVFFLGLLFFTGTFPNFPFAYQVQFKYVMFPFLLWASYSFKQRGSTLAVLMVSAVGIWGAVTGSGPFITRDDEQTLLFLDTFMAAISLTFLIFSAIVHEKDLAEAKITARERRFRSLIENSSDGIVLVDSFGTILYASTSVERILEYKPEDLLKTNGFNIIYKEDIKATREKLVELLRNPGVTLKLNNRLVTKSGKVRWMEAEGINLLNDPDVSGIVINFRDIEDRMALDKVRNEFVSLSAHQLRSPLSIIRWYVEALIKDQKVTDPVRSYLTEIFKAVMNMNETINLLLDVSRFELGRVHITSAPVALPQTIQTLIKDKNLEITSKGLIITTAFRDVPEILGDEKLIKVVIENFLSNAIKYTPKGGKIHISLIPQEHNILFKITDTGIGIPLDDQSRIFTKLFRGSNVKSVSPGGLGLGMYLVKLIVDLVGGTIRFESEENIGTTFFVEFPKKTKII